MLLLILFLPWASGFALPGGETADHLGGARGVLGVLEEPGLGDGVGALDGLEVVVEPDLVAHVGVVVEGGEVVPREVLAIDEDDSAPAADVGGLNLVNVGGPT